MSKYHFTSVETSRVIDCIQCTVTLDDLVEIESAVTDCETRTGHSMMQANQINVAMDIRLRQLAQVEKNPPTCCEFHRSGGHPGDRHGMDPMHKVYGLPA